MDEKRNKKDK